MSNRTLIELNHDYCPKDADTADWGSALQRYMRSGDKEKLPTGVSFIEMRHHSELSTIESLQKVVSSLRGIKKQRDIDISNLRFCAEMFKEHQWETVVTHWTVFEKTLREIADRLNGLNEAVAQNEKSQETFDISDARNRYEPCLVCNAEFGMGLVTKSGMLAVQCMECGFRGPEVPRSQGTGSDEAAFDAWNALARINQQNDVQALIASQRPRNE